MLIHIIMKDKEKDAGKFKRLDEFLTDPSYQPPDEDEKEYSLFELLLKYLIITFEYPDLPLGVRPFLMPVCNLILSFLYFVRDVHYELFINQKLEKVLGAIADKIELFEEFVFGISGTFGYPGKSRKPYLIPFFYLISPFAYTIYYAHDKLYSLRWDREVDTKYKRIESGGGMRFFHIEQIEEPHSLMH